MGLVANEQPVGLIFDHRGHAWLLAIEMIPIAPPVEAYHRLYRAVDLPTGIVEVVSEQRNIGISILMRALALAPTRGIVAIPTLGWSGLAVLCATLIGCALGLLRRRARH